MTTRSIRNDSLCCSGDVGCVTWRSPSYIQHGLPNHFKSWILIMIQKIWIYFSDTWRERIDLYLLSDTLKILLFSDDIHFWYFINRFLKQNRERVDFYFWHFINRFLMTKIKTAALSWNLCSLVCLMMQRLACGLLDGKFVAGSVAPTAHLLNVPGGPKRVQSC